MYVHFQDMNIIYFCELNFIIFRNNSMILHKFCETLDSFLNL